MEPEPRFDQYPQHLSTLLVAIHQAIDPFQAVSSCLQCTSQALMVSGHAVPWTTRTRVWIAALGKAAPSMARAAYAILGRRLTAGVVTLPRGMPAPAVPGLRFIAAGHPLPDDGSLVAGEAVREMLRTPGTEDILIALVSGGGSAMFEIPVGGISLDDLRTVNNLLLRSGAPIEEINCVRRALSQAKGGGLAALAHPARTVGLLLSDVVGDRFESIASGPTVLLSGSREQARAIVETYGLVPYLSAGVHAAIHQAEEQLPLTRPPINVLVASNASGLQAAAGVAGRLGFSVRIVSDRMQGETIQVARSFALSLKQARPPACLLLGGETTLVVENGGSGGRNQTFALAAAEVLDGASGRLLAAIATDGVDGPTDAGGAIVDGGTTAVLRRQGIDHRLHLQRRDAYPALRSARALILGGPTGTNVGDIVIGLAYGG